MTYLSELKSSWENKIPLRNTVSYEVQQLYTLMKHYNAEMNPRISTNFVQKKSLCEILLAMWSPKVIYIDEAL
jgi:hypothetical protein